MSCPAPSTRRVRSLALALSAVLSTTVGQAAPQDAELLPAGSLARASDGVEVCGLGREFHAGRRQALRAALVAEGGGVLVLRGLPDVRDNTSFRQDKNFWYLTGVETPNAAFVLDLDSGREVLFVNKPSRQRESWVGELWDTDDPWVSELTGVAELRAQRDLLDVVDELLGAEPRKLWTVRAPWVALAGSYDAARPFEAAQKKDPLDGRGSREDALADALLARFGDRIAGDAVGDATSALYAARLVKQPEEIAALRRAGHAGAVAMREAMRSTRPGLGEWELDALIAWFQQRHGADGPAYEAIVGSGRNALTLHYNSSTRRMRAGELVLIDFGPEVDHYTTDITRTFPVDGKFTEQQAAYYDAVLEAQLAGIAAARPGATLRDVDDACDAVLRARGWHKYARHSAVHWIGMAVHDPGDRRAELAPGMAFTVEPGLYDPESGIGIRIEDVVVITETGCRVLTGDVPKARAEIEALMAEAGVLDLLESDRR